MRDQCRQQCLSAGHEIAAGDFARGRRCPEIGAVTRVKSRLSAATSTRGLRRLHVGAVPARAAGSAGVVLLTARSHAAPGASSRGRARIARVRAASAPVRAARWALSARLTYGRGSMTNSTSPLRTSLPCLKLTEAMYPDTRGRISTRSTASKRPVNSPESVTLREMVVATVTCGTGGAAWDCAASLRAQALSSRAIADAASNGKEWRTRLSQMTVVGLGATTRPNGPSPSCHSPGVSELAIFIGR